jgi:hypothetical protein
MPDMRCSICEAVGNDGVMRISLGRSLLRCSRYGIHVVIGALDLSYPLRRAR